MGKTYKKRKHNTKKIKIQNKTSNKTIVKRKILPNKENKYTLSLSDKYIDHILNARVYDVCDVSPLQHAVSLSQQLGNNIYLKREDTHPGNSFKIRGAFNKMVHLSDEQLSRGIVTSSAGNHAQGVALSASKLGCKGVVVMPLKTPDIKVNAVRRFGGDMIEIILFGNNYDEAASEANRLAEKRCLTMIHPFNDPLVIAGQGTIGMEILHQITTKHLDAIFDCCGGGGMLAGIATYVKRVRPKVKIIGVEAADAAGMTTSLKAGKIVSLKKLGLFADGAAVRTIGTETFRLCTEFVDDMVTVTTNEICAAIKHGYEDTHVIMEPAGALGIAGAKKYLHKHNMKNKTVVAITSGSNVEFDRLPFIIKRANSKKT